MKNFYIITYDVSKDSDYRNTIEQFFTQDNSIELSQTTFLVFIDIESVKELCKSIEITNTEKFCVLEISNPKNIKILGIPYNQNIQNFISLHLPQSSVKITYDRNLPFHS